MKKYIDKIYGTQPSASLNSALTMTPNNKKSSRIFFFFDKVIPPVTKNRHKRCTLDTTTKVIQLFTH